MNFINKKWNNELKLEGKRIIKRFYKQEVAKWFKVRRENNHKWISWTRNGIIILSYEEKGLWISYSNNQIYQSSMNIISILISKYIGSRPIAVKIAAFGPYGTPQ